MLGFFIFRVGLVTGHKQATVKNRVGFRRSQHEMLKIPTRFFFRVEEPNTICHTPIRSMAAFSNLSFLNRHPNENVLGKTKNRVGKGKFTVRCYNSTYTLKGLQVGKAA